MKKSKKTCFGVRRRLSKKLSKLWKPKRAPKGRRSHSGEAAVARLARWTRSGTSPALTAAGLTMALDRRRKRSYAQLLRRNVIIVTESGTLRGSASKSSKLVRGSLRGHRGGGD